MDLGEAELSEKEAYKWNEICHSAVIVNSITDGVESSQALMNLFSLPGKLIPPT
jgi:hypothetical protein